MDSGGELSYNVTGDKNICKAALHHILSPVTYIGILFTKSTNISFAGFKPFKAHRDT